MVPTTNVRRIGSNTADVEIGKICLFLNSVACVRTLALRRSPRRTRGERGKNKENTLLQYPNPISGYPISGINPTSVPQAWGQLFSGFLVDANTDVCYFFSGGY